MLLDPIKNECQTCFFKTFVIKRGDSILNLHTLHGCFKSLQPMIKSEEADLTLIWDEGK